MRRIMRFVCAGVLSLSALLGSVLAWAAPLGASISLLSEPEEVEPELSVTMMYTDAEISYKWSPAGRTWVNNSQMPYSKLEFTNTSDVAVDVVIAITSSDTIMPITGVWLSGEYPDTPSEYEGVSSQVGSDSLTLTNLPPKETATAYLVYAYAAPNDVSDYSGTTTLTITLTPATTTGGEAS